MLAPATTCTQDCAKQKLLPCPQKLHTVTLTSLGRVPSIAGTQKHTASRRAQGKTAPRLPSTASPPRRLLRPPIVNIRNESPRVADEDAGDSAECATAAKVNASTAPYPPKIPEVLEDKTMQQKTVASAAVAVVVVPALPNTKRVRFLLVLAGGVDKNVHQIIILLVLLPYTFAVMQGVFPTQQRV